ncbi:hypothetical protein GW756_05400 [bacterium]|nr:hypothetical protein [bacterium]NCQ55337.1 hypothetical protein [Candidatus Parcubacteria bacterium]NCS67150.1 hypothetical protein [Candidatus Peregrinibacteria bacterium]NCS96776.1 hypothetical protein [bacterium]
MKKRSKVSVSSICTAMMLAVVLNLTVVSTADAFLGSISQGVASIGAAVQAGTNLISSIQGLFGGGGGGGGLAVSSGVPTVPNGGILPGPANAAYGVSYARDVFLPNLTNWIVSVVLAGSVIVLIAAGLMYLIGGGNQELQTKARETIIWGILGMVITVISYSIVRIVITINYLG